MFKAEIAEGMLLQAVVNTSVDGSAARNNTPMDHAVKKTSA